MVKVQCRTALTTVCPFRAAVTRKPLPELLVSRLMGEEQYRITIKPERLLEPCLERGLRGWKVLDFDGHTYHAVAAVSC